MTEPYRLGAALALPEAERTHLRDVRQQLRRLQAGVSGTSIPLMVPQLVKTAARGTAVGASSGLSAAKVERSGVVSDAMRGARKLERQERPAGIFRARDVLGARVSVPAMIKGVSADGAGLIAPKNRQKTALDAWLAAPPRALPESKSRRHVRALGSLGGMISETGVLQPLPGRKAETNPRLRGLTPGDRSGWSVFESSYSSDGFVSQGAQFDTEPSFIAPVPGAASIGPDRTRDPRGLLITGGRQLAAEFSLPRRPNARLAARFEDHVSSNTHIEQIAPQAASIRAASLRVSSQGGARSLGDDGSADGGAGGLTLQSENGGAARSDAHPNGPGASPVEGDVYLDGTLLGRWVSRNLAREASRPSAGGAAFDARRNALPAGRMIGA